MLHLGNISSCDLLQTVPAASEGFREFNFINLAHITTKFAGFKINRFGDM